MSMPITHDRFPPTPHDDASPRGTHYELHQALGTSWKESLMVLPLLLVGAGAALWVVHQPATRLQARVETHEEVKAIGTTGRIAVSTRAGEPIPVGTTGTIPTGTV